MVKKLEELGIGRPSTYASILAVLQDRNYVLLNRKRFVPEDKGRLVTAFLESYFHRYVEYDFHGGFGGAIRFDICRRSELEDSIAGFLAGFFERCGWDR